MQESRKQLLRRLARERARRRMIIDEKLLRDMSTKQLGLILDPAKRKTAKCGRRSGKTTCIGTYLVVSAINHPGLITPYIALSKGHARRLMWPILHELDRKHGLNIKFNETELMAMFSSGAKIWLTGADRPQEIEKLRGGAYPLVAIDESASFGPRLEYLIDDVLDAALGDYDGTLLMVGTPGAACVGKFYDATTSEVGWSRHVWTVVDNPHFPRWAGHQNYKLAAIQWLHEKMKQRGWEQDNPVFRREWLGEWVHDDASLVYCYDSIKNDYDELPSGEWRYIIGVDLGYDDATAISVVAYCPQHPAAYLVEDYKGSSLDVSRVIDTLQRYVDKYKPLKIVADTGGLGKMIVEEMRKRSRMNIHAAQKTDKRAHVEMLKDDLRCGRFFAKKSSHFAQEAALLQWDESGDKEDDRFENHACDATLYSHREMLHYLHKKDPEPVVVGTNAYYALEAERLKKERAAQISKRTEKDWWE